MSSSAVRVVTDAPPAGVQKLLRVPPWMIWTFAAAIALTYFGLLGRFALAEPDEARYAEIAREMIELHDWVTPHLNYVKYFEKPPLMYWLTALNFLLFGMSEFVVRLWPALFAIGGILVTSVVARSMYGEWVGYAAAALLAATPFYFGLGQIVILDMPLTALMTIALGAFWVGWHDSRRRRSSVRIFYAASALAALTKGPVAIVLIGGIVVVFLVLQRELRALRWLISPLGVVIFGAIALPWFVLVSRRNAEFLDFFIVKQHLDRFLRPTEHQEPIWFFIPIVFGGMLPWTAFVLLAPRVLWRFLRRVAARRLSAAAVFCIVWSSVVVLFFSLSGSKLATYALPAFCPLAILAARFFQQLIVWRRVRFLERYCVVVFFLAVLAVIGGAISGAVIDDWRMAIILPRLYAAAGVLIVGAAAALVLLRRGALQSTFAVLLGAVLLLQVIAISGRGVNAQYRPLALAIRHRLSAGDQIVSYRHYVQGITFYARSRTVMAGGRGELDFGSRQGDQRDFFWDTDAQLVAAWRSPRRLFLVINRAELEPLRPQLEPAPREIAAYGKKVVVVNFTESAASAAS
jgi:4-amino-4-deoxy-L-arabinose transferase-like glycosyltransferase